MGLQIDRLEKVRTTGGGLIHARCPACAVESGDTKGEHLIIYPDGRFGCCVNPGDKQHRKRIFALAGEATKRQVKPVVVVRKASATQSARQWKVVNVAMPPLQPPTSHDPKLPVPSVPEAKSGSSLPLVGTHGTPFFNLRALQEKTSYTHIHTYGSLEHSSQASQPTSNGEDLKLPVPSVPNQSLALKGPRPFIDSSGGLVIPSNSPARYQWWKGGQSVDETLNEIQSEGTFSTFTAAQVAVPNQPP
jgi:hypothetical protein